MGYKLVGVLTATLVLKTGLENQYYHHLSLMGLQVRGGFRDELLLRAGVMKNENDLVVPACISIHAPPSTTQTPTTTAHQPKNRSAP